LHEFNTHVQRALPARSLGELPSDGGSYSALAKTLEEDPSYAVRAAAALSLGRSRNPAALELLQKERASHPEIHLATALDTVLAATGATQAVFGITRRCETRCTGAAVPQRSFGNAGASKRDWSSTA
jgi:HEAT repeat protein